jgi:hypothetical protein
MSLRSNAGRTIKRLKRKRSLFLLSNRNAFLRAAPVLLQTHSMR